MAGWVPPSQRGARPHDGCSGLTLRGSAGTGRTIRAVRGDRERGLLSEGKMGAARPEKTDRRGVRFPRQPMPHTTSALGSSHRRSVSAGNQRRTRRELWAPHGADRFPREPTPNTTSAVGSSRRRSVSAGTNAEHDECCGLLTPPIGFRGNQRWTRRAVWAPHTTNRFPRPRGKRTTRRHHLLRSFRCHRPFGKQTQVPGSAPLIASATAGSFPLLGHWGTPLRSRARGRSTVEARVRRWVRSPAASKS
jgi:hypothetical protein